MRNLTNLGTPRPSGRAETTSFLRAATVALALLTSACGDQIEPPLPQSVSAPHIPYEYFGSQGVIDLRPGESRVVRLSVTSGGLDTGPISLTGLPFQLPEGVSVVGGPPAMIDMTDSRFETYEVEFRAASDAPTAFGSYSVHIVPVLDGLENTETTDDKDYSALDVNVVAPDVDLGPVALSDVVDAPPDGITFDPTNNDTPRDFPIDPANISITNHAIGNGKATVAGPGPLRYEPGSDGGDQFEYEICDTAGLCASAILTMWTDLNVPAS